jgi:hypothetical protein
MASTIRKHAADDIVASSSANGLDLDRPAKRSKQDEGAAAADALDVDEDPYEEYDAGPSEPSKASDLYLDTVSNRVIWNSDTS